ncbi:MAG: DUF805 domain-containing protein [Prevotella sp.]|nr:DUF805 domain-containing protein [Prevotella sp.]
MNVIAREQLGFMEAVKLAWSRLTEMNGRSRRSEFWWAMLAFMICYWVLSMVVSVALPLLAAQIVISLLMLLVLPLTARRLQDGGHSKWWVVVAWVASTVSNIYMAVSPAMDALTSVNPDPEAVLGLYTDPVIIVCGLVSAVAGIATFVFCLMDGKPEANQYGESPKYYTPY